MRFNRKIPTVDSIEARPIKKYRLMAPAFALPNTYPLRYKLKVPDQEGMQGGLRGHVKNVSTRSST